jgi:glycosyltransferase involved in cell wall biosynthesis
MPVDLEADVATSGSRAGTAAATGERRVLVLAPQPLGEARGTPIAVCNVLEALSELQCAVDLLTYPVGPAVDIPGVRVLPWANPLGIRHVPIGFSLRKLLLDVTLVPALWHGLRRQRYSCIHAVEEAAFPAVVLGRHYGVPVIYDMQSSLPEQLVKHRLLRGRRVQAALRACEAWLLRRADAVVSSAGLLHKVSHSAPATLAREWHFPPSATAPEVGSVGALRAGLGIPDHAPVVVYAGTFEPYQGLSMLVGAVDQVVRAVPHAVFVLVGGDREPAELLRREVAQLKLNGSIRLLGRKPRAEIPAYLAMADVLVSPRSYGDNLPLKVFDYLSAGRAIIATDLPAHRALLDESRALLAEPTTAGLATAIIDLLRSPSRAAELAAAARDYAAANLGWAGFVAKVEAVYDEVTNQPPVAPRR